MSKEVAELNEKLKEVAETAEEINAQEKMFGWAASKYGHIAQMAQTLEPYYNLWTTTSWFLNKFSEWMTGPFSKLDPERVSEEVLRQPNTPCNPTASVARHSAAIRSPL